MKIVAGEIRHDQYLTLQMNPVDGYQIKGTFLGFQALPVLRQGLNLFPLDKISKGCNYFFAGSRNVSDSIHEKEDL